MMKGAKNMKKRLLATILGVAILFNNTVSLCAEELNTVSENGIIVQEGEAKPTINEETIFSIDGLEIPEGYVLPKDNMSQFLKETSEETLDCSKSSIVLPASYDGRKYQTAVKKQYGNTCWIYANIAAVEASMIKNGLADTSLDLSELHHIYFYYNRITDPLDNITKDYVSFLKNGSMSTDFASYVDAGGENNSVTERLLNRVGPVSESLAPFTSKEQGYISSDFAFGHNAADVVGVKYCGFSLENATIIKELIYTYGAVTGGYYSVSSSKYYKNVNDTMTYYYPDTIDSTNHAITIVGWDDNYSASNFSQIPPGNGAWLCKNSWGTENFLNSSAGSVDGYLWISYYDGSYVNGNTTSAAFITEKANTDKYLYQYDGSCYYMTDADKKSYLNIFKTKGMTAEMESINAVSVNIGPSTGYSIKLYVNPVIKGGKIISYDFASESQHCSSNETGVYKTRLNTAVYVNKGDTFAVEIIMDNPASVIGFSKSYSDSTTWHHDERESNTFYYQTTDGVYEEFVSGSYAIKAFTNDSTLPSATGVTLSEEEITLGAGETYNLSAGVSPSTALQQVRFSSTNTNVATVDGTGKITAVGNGTCQIKVTSWDKKAEATCEVKVTNLVKEIKINTEPCGSISIKKGQSQTLSVEILPENAEDKSVLWFSSHTTVANIGKKTGKVNGLSYGKTTIMAGAGDDGSAAGSAVVYVINPVSEIKLQSDQNLAQRAITLHTNDNNTATLSAEVNADATITGVDVTNSNPEIASYDESTGELKALQNGTTEITFTSKDGAVPSVFHTDGTVSAGEKITEKVTVTVGTKVEDFSFENDEITIGTGQVTAPSGKFAPTNVSDKTVNYTSSNPEVVSINEKGYLVGKKPGTAIITGTPVLAKDKTLQDTITVNVIQHVEEVQAPDSIYLEMGEEIVIGSERFNPVALPETASNRNLTYVLECNDRSVELEENTLRGTFYGQAELSIKAEDSGTVKKKVTVYCVQKAAWLWMATDDMEFNQATTVPLVATLDENATEQRLKWSSSDETVATVSNDGDLTLTGKAGTAVITVSTIDGSNLTQRVKVTFKKLVQSLSFGSYSYFMNKGETKQLDVQLTPSDATNKNLSYASSNPSVATVNNGTVTAVGEGSAVITVTATDGSGCLASTSIVVSSQQQQATQQQQEQEKEEEEEQPKNLGKEIKAKGLKYKVTAAKEVSFTGPESKKTKKVTVPATVTVDGTKYSVTTIADSAFTGCTKLKEVNLPQTLEKIGKKAFKGCTKITTITIPGNVAEIGNEAFSGCSGLTSVKIGGKVKTIGKKAFYKCTALKKVSIPASVKTIGSSAFSGCTAMTSVVIGRNVTSIGSKAFYGCKKLKKIDITSTKLKTVGKKAFYKVAKKCKITMPANKKKAYKKLLKGKYSSV